MKNNIRVELTYEEASYREVFDKLCEGDKEARRILSYMKDVDLFAMDEFIILDDMNIRGTQIVYARDYCGWNVRELFDSIRKRDPKMVEAVNREVAKKKATKHKAVVGGAVGNREFLTDEEVETLKSLPRIYKGLEK